MEDDQEHDGRRLEAARPPRPPRPPWKRSTTHCHSTTQANWLRVSGRATAKCWSTSSWSAPSPSPTHLPTHPPFQHANPLSVWDRRSSKWPGRSSTTTDADAHLYFAPFRGSWCCFQFEFQPRHPPREHRESCRTHSRLCTYRVRR